MAVWAGSASVTPAFSQAARAAPSVASTGETVLTSAQLAAMAGARRPVVISYSDPAGLTDLYRQGIQGKLRIAGYIGVDGRVHDAHVIESSRSAELDEAGVAAINTTTFKPAMDATGKALAVQTTIPLEYWKDDLSNIGNKTCRDFVVDADWHAKTFPEERPNQLRSYSLATGMFFAHSGTVPHADFQTIYQACAAHPEMKYLAAIMAAG